MESLQRNLIVAQLLRKVFTDGAYSSIELNKSLSTITDTRDKAYITKLFYGVLSKNTQLDYILARLVDKNPKQIVRIVLKMGFYMLRYMNMPDYAVISTQVELTKKIGKQQLSGMVNAVLRKSSTVAIPIADENAVKEISVNYSCPEWIVGKLVKQLGKENAIKYLSANLPEKTHIRLNKRYITTEQFLQKLPNAQPSASGYYLTADELTALRANEYTVQSLSSMLAVEYYAKDLVSGATVLDTCAAPGGKAVYMRQLNGGNVTACDIHAHRVQLIKSYANRMGEEITAVVNDATVINEQFIDKFDCVICDVPCSGLGVIFSKPDVMLTRQPQDIAQLRKLQLNILTVSANYVKVGGYLNYSTCTVLSEENESVVNEFLSTHGEYELVGDFMKLYPYTHGCDGFFVAKLRRVK